MTTWIKYVWHKRAGDTEPEYLELPKGYTAQEYMDQMTEDEARLYGQASMEWDIVDRPPDDWIRSRIHGMHKGIEALQEGIAEFRAMLPANEPKYEPAKTGPRTVLLPASKITVLQRPGYTDEVTFTLEYGSPFMSSMEPAKVKCEASPKFGPQWVRNQLGVEPDEIIQG